MFQPENMHNLMLAFALTMAAGLATGIGSLISLLSKRTDTRFLSAALGLSAGVMIYVSFMELMPESAAMLKLQFGDRLSEVYALLSFFAGIGFIALIDKLVPEDENPHELQFESKDRPAGKLKRTGVMMALAIGIHNFPEGLATFASAMENIEIALPIVFAIAIHNIPEGIAVSVPIYHATGSRKKAFAYSFLSGMAEPVGAVIGFIFLSTFWTPAVNALVLGFVSGIMVYISFDELLPGMEKYGHHHLGVAGTIAGMAIMALSLLLL